MKRLELESVGSDTTRRVVVLSSLRTVDDNFVQKFVAKRSDDLSFGDVQMLMQENSIRRLSFNRSQAPAAVVEMVFCSGFDF